MADYDHELNEAQKLFWDKLMAEYNDLKNTTRTKVRILEEKVKEHEGLLVGLFRQMTSSFGGLMKLDEKLKGKK